MKKIQAIFIVICFVMSLLVIGCGGGNDNEVGPAPVSSVFIMAVTASGDDGSSNAGFSLSVKKNITTSIFPAVSVSQNKIKLKVQPLKDGTESGNPVLVDTASLSVASNTISANVAVEATTNQYSVEVFAAGNEGNPLLKSIVATAQAPKNGETLAAIVNASSTAFSMVYTQWLSQGPSDKNYSTFIYNVSTSLSDIASISLLIQDNLNKAAKSGSSASYSPLTDSDVKTQVTNFANGVKKEAPANPINASDIAGTWEVVKKSESQGNVDKVLKTKPNPSGKYESFIFTSDGSFTQTEYTQVYNSNTDEIVFSDQISATSQGNWTIQGNTLSLAFSKKLKDYTVSFSSEGYLKFYPTSTANGVVLFLRKMSGNAKTLSDIALSPASIAMNPDGNYNLSQVAVTAVYSDNSSQLITAVTWSKASGNGTVTGAEYKAPSSTGSDVLTCSYSEGGVTKTTNLTVSIVRGTILSNLSLSTGNISVGVGVTFDLTPIVVTAVYSDNTKKTITAVVWSKKSGNGNVSSLTYTSPSAPGTDVLTCSFTENGVTRTIDLTVTVTQTKVLSSIILAPSTISVNTTASYALSQILVTALFSDGASKTVTNVSWGKKSANGSLSGTTYLAPSASGTDILTCTYTENGETKTADLSITINSSTAANPAQTLSSLNLSSPSIVVNTNGTYNLGQLVVTANYSNNANQTVLTPVWSVKSGGGSVNGGTFAAPGSPGTVYLTCSYTENGVTKTVDLTVTISTTKTLSNISFSVASITLIVSTSYNLSQVSVTANYSDNTSQAVTNVVWSTKSGGGSLSGSTYTAPASSGTAILTCSYTESGTTKTDDMNVNILPVPDTTSPVISGIVATEIKATSVKITWTTDENSTSQVDYGLTTSYGTQTTIDSSMVQNHSVTIPSLTAGVTYHFRVRSKDASNNEAISSDGSFSTLSVLWQKMIGGSSYDECYDFFQAATGDLIIAGRADSNNGDFSGNHGGQDAFLAKLASDGSLITTKCFGSSGDDKFTSIRATSDGGLICVGDSGANNGDVSGHHGLADCWVVKLDSSWNIQWQKSFGGSASELGLGVQLTSDGGYIICSMTGSSDGDVVGHHLDWDIWLIKLNSSGTAEWKKCLGGNGYDQIGNAGIKEVSDGFIVAGTTTSNDGDVSGNHGDWDVWLAKVNLTGTLVWQKCFGGTNKEWAQQIYTTSDGGYIFMGSVNSLDGDVIGNHGGKDFWVVKLDSSRNIQSQKCLGGTLEDAYGKETFQTTDGGYVIPGMSFSSDGDLTSNKGLGDYWVVKLDSSLNLVWKKSLGGSAWEMSYRTKQLSDNYFLAVGGSESNDGDAAGNHGNRDGWIIKFAP